MLDHKNLAKVKECLVMHHIKPNKLDKFSSNLELNICDYPNNRVSRISTVLAAKSYAAARQGVIYIWGKEVKFCINPYNSKGEYIYHWWQLPQAVKFVVTFCH